MTAEDMPRRRPAGAGGHDVFLLLQAEDLAADDAGHVEPVGNAQGQVDVEQARLEDDHEQNDVEQHGNGIEDVDDMHHDLVRPAADEAGNAAVDDADEDVDQAGDEADGQGNAGAVEDADEEVTAQGIRTEPVRSRRPGIGCRQILVGISIGRQPGAGNGQEAHDDDDGQAP